MSKWIEKPLAQLVTFQKGRKVDTSFFSKDGYLAYLGASGIEGRDDGYGDPRFGVIAEPSDTLMLWDGERSGLVGFGRHGVVASTVSKLSPSENIDPQYLYFFLLANFDWIQHRRTGTGVPHVPKDLGRLLNVSYPKSKATQRKIATILATIDTAIEQTEALIEKYQHIKAGLMHVLFTRGVLPNGQLRPPREQAPELYQEAAIGWIPKVWRVSRLETILRNSGGHLQTGPFGSQLHAHEYQSDGIPVVMPQDINDGRIGIESIARISEKRALSLAKHQLKVGDIIIARRGELSRAAAVSVTEQGWLCGTGCFLLRLGRTDLNHFFFSHIYRYDYIQRQIAGTQVGTTMPSLNNAVMGRVFFPCPTPSEQSEISTRLSKSEREIDSLKKHAEKFKLQKLGLMQDLLTGKVPVTVGAPPSEAIA
jgi:type I restriction enzyme S subunit